MICKTDTRSLSEEALEVFLSNIGQKPFRARQIYDWLWNKGVDEIKAMVNLPKKLRKQLQTSFSLHAIQLTHSQQSLDGTTKHAMCLHDEKIIESVLIPTENRSTACVSSQVGCSLDCRFYATEQLVCMRNLQAGEIFDQVRLLEEQSQKQFGRPLSNLVFMGMGEPLLNYSNVINAIKKITTSKGLRLSSGRITLSTSGIPKMIQKLADEQPRLKLALSLHSAREKIRQKIMPFSKNFPLEDLMKALQYWYEKTKSPITFEYVVWKNINDQIEDIRALVKFCRAVPSKVNLIEYNPIGDKTFLQADKATLKNYVETLEKSGIVTKVRHSRGKDIDAACGQLVNKTLSINPTQTQTSRHEASSYETFALNNL